MDAGNESMQSSLASVVFTEEKQEGFEKKKKKKAEREEISWEGNWRIIITNWR